jgi:dihydropyrimidinase
MGYDLVVAGGTVVTARKSARRDVCVRAGRIARVGATTKRTRALAKRVVDASGCLVIPGAVDPHVHFALSIGTGMRTADDFDSGTRAAAAGGITTIIDYTTPKPKQGPLPAFSERRRLADGRVHVDYSLHNVLIGWDPSWREDLESLVKQGAPSVKLFTIYADRGWQADDGMMYQVMEACRDLGMVVCVHAENDSLIELYTSRTLELPPGRRPKALGLALARPPLVEEEAVARTILLAEATGARLHLVHLSTRRAAELVGEARRLGLPVSGETCPQYLALDETLLAGKDGHLWGCCPPLRGADDREGLGRALKKGFLSAVTTDHCTFTRKQKDSWWGDFLKIPYGLPGVETSLAVTYTLGPAKGNISPGQWVRIHTEGPARLFGLYPQKGVIKTGSDADLVVWDPRVTRTIRADDLQTDCDWSPYQGMKLRGLARHVFLRGTEVAQDSRYCGPGGEGRLIGTRRGVRSGSRRRSGPAGK